MCGIVGYIGHKNSKDIVIEGLSRLEYRGYDSAGICMLDSESDELVVYKKMGKIENLKKVLNGKSPKAHLAIGHTRWATHGKVNDINAHPHESEDYAIVHNGIIENATELKQELEHSGASFKSETDSEVFLHLFLKNISDGKPILDAFRETFLKIKGNSAIVLLAKKERQIYAVKRSAPLVCGLNTQTGEVLASSDPYALIGTADDLYFPENEIIAVLSEKDPHLNFFDINGNPSKSYLEKKQESNLEASDKGEFDHYMLKEIHEQPDLIREILVYYQQGPGKDRIQEIITDVDIQRVHIVACGTALHAGLLIKNFFEQYNRLYAFVDFASEFRYMNPLLKPKDGAIFISQSGETADTLAAQELVKKAGIPTMAIVNVEGSTLYRDCDYNLLINAGFEIGVASTKAFTQMVLAGYFLSKSIAGKLQEQSINKEVSILADRFDELISRAESIKSISEKLHNYKGYIFTGRGIYYPVALEGALKLKEIAYVHAEGYASGELKHGPIALIDEEMVNVAIVGPELYDKTVSNIEEVKARKGLILTIGPVGDKNLERISDFYIPINYEGLNELSPVLVNLALQLFSYYLALFKGTDIDKPRNLAKSVTVE